MSCYPERVCPQKRYCAEVVVLVTSLGAHRAEENACRAARDLLEIKRVHCKIVDYNRDARGADRKEVLAIEQLITLNPILTTEGNDFSLPHIFIDGWYIGGVLELQGLEDDGLLGRILRRQLCFICSKVKSTDELQCTGCSALYTEVLPGHKSIDDAVAQFSDDNGESGGDSGKDCRAALAYRIDERNKQIKASYIVDGRQKPKVIQKGAEIHKRLGAAFDGTAKQVTIMADEKDRSAFSSVLRKSVTRRRAQQSQVRATVKSMPRESLPRLSRSISPPTLPEIKGYLWKKSPNPYRTKAFERRYFIVSHTHIAWWNTEEASTDTSGERKGYIDLVATNVEIELDLGNETTFMVKPKDGVWKDGSIAKGGKGKTFILDTEGSEHSRSNWTETIESNMGRAEQLSKHEDVVVPDTDFYFALGLPIPAGPVRQVIGSTSPERQPSANAAPMPASWQM